MTYNQNYQLAQDCLTGSIPLLGSRSDWGEGFDSSIRSQVLSSTGLTPLRHLKEWQRCVTLREHPRQIEALRKTSSNWLVTDEELP